MKTIKNLITTALFVFVISCSTPQGDGVLSISSTDTPETTIEILDISSEDAQLIMAECLRENGFEIQDPSGSGGLREQLGPIAENREEREALLEQVRLCAEENNLPLFSETGFEDPEVIAARLDDELKIAQCLRENGFEVQDPNTETGLRELLRPLIMSGQYDNEEIRTTIETCFDELGIERPEGPGGGQGNRPGG